MGAATTLQQDTSLDAKCRETIDRAFPFFVIHNNHVTIQPNTTLFSISSQVFAAALAVFAFPPESDAVLAADLSLRKLLAAVFDPDHRAFVLGDDATSARILAVLDEDARACILAQAIAGMVFVLRRLAELHGDGNGAGLTEAALDRQLRLFAGSEQRRAVLDRVERSRLWGNCFAKPEILSMIMEAIAVDMAPDEGRSSPRALELEDDVLDPIAWVNEQRPTRDLGVPDGLTIMTLN